MRALLLLLSLGLLMVAGQAIAAAPTAGPDNAELQIRASLAAWVTAFNSGDYMSGASVWAPDMVGWSPDGPDDSYSIEQKQAKLAQGKLPPVTYSLEVVDVTVSGDMALVRDIWTENPKADSSKAHKFRSFEIWRRQPDASWKISRWIDGPAYTPPAGSH